MDNRRSKIGIVGCGTVGSALIDLLHGEADIEIVALAVKEINKARSTTLTGISLTDKWQDVVNNNEIEIVVELVGGLDPAKDIVETSLKNKKSVVTGNKELIAKYGNELEELASRSGVDLFYEAAVAGAIPIVKVLRESLKAENITRFLGIVNGTTNYILTSMSIDGLDFDTALKQAQDAGFAEKSSPEKDTEGFDAASKAAILASLGFSTKIDESQVYREGISHIERSDILYAKSIGYEIKLLAIGELLKSKGNNDEKEVALRVHPALVPESHPLASVRGAYNAIFVEGSAIGEMMLYGRGAGGPPTASAVLGDIHEARVNRISSSFTFSDRRNNLAIKEIEDLISRYYLTLEVLDEPGVLAKVATIFGRFNVSISSMEQIGAGEDAKLIFLTHDAQERDIRQTVKDLEQLSHVVKVGRPIRILESNQ